MALTEMKFSRVFFSFKFELEESHFCSIFNQDLSKICRMNVGGKWKPSVKREHGLLGLF